MDQQDESSRRTNVGSTPSSVGVSPNDTPENVQVRSQEDSGSKRKQNEGIEGEENAPKKNKKATSRAWEHFTKKQTKDGLKAVCNHCNRDFVGDSQQGTSHLLNHIDYRCPNYKGGQQKDIRGMMGGQKALVGQMVNGAKVMSVTNFEQEVSRDKLAKMVILHDFPLSIVDYVGFREFVFSLQPSFKMITRNTLKSDIFKVYGIEKEKVVKLLALANGRVSLTTDVWTSKNKRRGFMVITAHFVDEKWKLQSIILRFIYVPSPHTAAALQEVLLDAMLEWNVDRRMGCLTVDNCTTNDLMVRLLLEKLQLSTLLVRGEFFHMRCAAHIINLIVQDGLKVIEGFVGKVRDSVSFWIASPKRRQKFRETADQIPVACSKELVLDCKTRWNSTYIMLSIALEYKDVFFRLRQRERDYVTLPSEEEWERAQEICVKLGLFYDVTCVFSGTNYPTSNVYFSKVCQMKIQMTEWLFSPLAYIREMAKLMLDKFDDYWSDTHGIMGVASMLDPRLKMTFMDLYIGISKRRMARGKMTRMTSNECVEE